MDDDLMSLRGGGSSPSEGGGDDDLFASLGDPAPASSSAAPGDALGLGLEGFDAPASKPAAPSAAKKAAKPPAKKKPARKRSGGSFLGLTPQQWMLLSIFLFMDVAMFGCLILLAVGAIPL